MATGGGIIGRAPELDTLREIPRALLLTGEAGIGKTTLWQAGIDVAQATGRRVLAARPSEAEARLSFAGLTDLLESVDTESLTTVPPPQLRALEVALLRAEPSGTPLEPRAIGAGLQSALRELAATQPLVIAVDDAQWLDPSSAASLTFAARRLADDDVRFLITRRSGTGSELEKALQRRGLERLEVQGLSLGATRRLLFERLGLIVPRRLLRRIFDASRGNPLFALELGRTLASGPEAAIAEDIPVPDVIGDLLGARVANLAPEAQRLLLAVALDGELSVSNLDELVGTESVEEAVDAGVIAVDGDRARASHPLLAAVARERSTARQRRTLHAALAELVTDAELRARHLALATGRPDANLATEVAAAAATAHSRGALGAAVELAEHAVRLTSPDSPQRDERLLVLADYLLRFGEWRRAQQLLEPEIRRMATGAARARCHLLLAVSEQTLAGHERRLELARGESADDPALRALVLTQMSDVASAADVTRIPQAEAWALEADELARAADPATVRWALYSLGWARVLRGRDVEDLRGRFEAASADAPDLYRSIDRLAAIRLGFRGEIERARAAFAGLLALADERGEGPAYDTFRLQLCEIELRAGNWEAASALLDEWDESPTSENMDGVRERCHAVLTAGRGCPDDVERWAQVAIAGYEVHGQRWELLEAQRARGVGALLAHEPARALEGLRSVWTHMEREGIEEPGAFPVAPDLVECLVELGELDEAGILSDSLQRRAEEQEHPWGLATATRCRSLVQFALRTDEEEAAAGLAEAAVAYGGLGLRFDRARSLLLLGRAQRRRRKWAAARAALEEAAATFEALGSPGWVEEARSELGRVGARRPQAAGALTVAEDRVVRLAAEGRSNKEIAAALFVTVHTVEAHLSHAYAKLGVRSRSQLAGVLAAGL